MAEHKKVYQSWHSTAIQIEKKLDDIMKVGLNLKCYGRIKHLAFEMLVEVVHELGPNEATARKKDDRIYF